MGLNYRTKRRETGERSAQVKGPLKRVPETKWTKKDVYRIQLIFKGQRRKNRLSVTCKVR